MSKQISWAARGLRITASSELCWEKELGGAPYSCTYQVRRLAGKGLAAIKTVDIVLIAKIRGVSGERVWKEMLADVAILNSLPDVHQGIMGYFQITTNPARDKLYLWKNMGDFSMDCYAFSEERHIQQATKFGRFSYLIHFYALQIVSALSAIHRQGLVHGKITLENIIMTRNGSADATDAARVQISDPLINRNASFDFVHHSVYWPLEMFRGTAGAISSSHKAQSSAEADCYMTGLLLAELASAQRLTEITLAPLCLQANIMQSLQKRVSDNFRVLGKCVSLLLQQNARCRATAEQLIPILVGYLEGHKMHSEYGPLPLHMVEVGSRKTQDNGASMPLHEGNSLERRSV